MNLDPITYFGMIASIIAFAIYFMKAAFDYIDEHKDND
jgi:hypothetical protein